MHRQYLLPEPSLNIISLSLSGQDQMAPELLSGHMDQKLLHFFLKVG